MSTGQGSPRPSAAVYRRRRIIVGLAALVVLALVGWGLVAGIGAIARALGGNDKPSTQSSAPSTSQAAPDPSATETSKSSSTPAGVNPDGSCPAGAVTLTASTDQRSYSAKQKPVLSMTLRNTLSEPCTTNVGTSQQEFLVTSGSDRIFSTKDCQKNAKDTEFTLQPGQDERAEYTWDRRRSLPKCAAIDSSPRAGTYTLEVSLGKTESEKVQFVLK